MKITTIAILLTLIMSNLSYAQNDNICVSDSVGENFKIYVEEVVEQDMLRTGLTWDRSSLKITFEGVKKYIYTDQQVELEGLAYTVNFKVEDQELSMIDPYNNYFFLPYYESKLTRDRLGRITGEICKLGYKQYHSGAMATFSWIINKSQRNHVVSRSMKASTQLLPESFIPE